MGVDVYFAVSTQAGGSPLIVSGHDLMVHAWSLSVQGWELTTHDDGSRVWARAGETITARLSGITLDGHRPLCGLRQGGYRCYCAAFEELNQARGDAGLPPMQEDHFSCHKNIFEPLPARCPSTCGVRHDG